MAVSQTRSTRAAHSLVPFKTPSAAVAETQDLELEDAEGVDPPPMARHDAREFAFARRTLLGMVMDSQFFPLAADDSRWFRPCGGGVVDRGGREGAGDAEGASERSAVAEDAERKDHEEVKSAASEASSLTEAVADDDAAAPAAANEVAPVPSVHERDIDYGDVLGSGSFCEVRLVTLRGDRG